MAFVALDTRLASWDSTEDIIQTQLNVLVDSPVVPLKRAGA